MSHLMTKPTKWHVHPAKTDQTVHLPSLNRVFAVRTKKALVLSYPLSAQSKSCRWNGRQCRPWSDCSSRSSLIWVCTVCQDLSVWKLRTITVHMTLVLWPLLSNSIQWFYSYCSQGGSKNLSTIVPCNQEFCNKQDTKWAASWQNQQNGMCAQRRQISLGIFPVWSESSLSTWRKLWSLATHWAHNKDSDQTGRMPRLIWVFAGRTVILLVLSWGGSN